MNIFYSVGREHGWTALPGNSLQQELNHPLGAADKLLTSPKASWISWLTDECVCLLRAFSVGMKRFSHQMLKKEPKTTLTCWHCTTSQNGNLIFECVKHANQHVWYMMLDTQKESGVFDGVPAAKDNCFSHACVPAAVLEGRWWLWACSKTRLSSVVRTGVWKRAK